VDILSKSIHPPVPASASAWGSKEDETFLPLHLVMFILALAPDANLWNLSATDSNGINSSQKRVSEIGARLHVFWARKLPVWHISPPILRNDRCAPSVLLMEVDSLYETFKAFISSSSAFLHLARSMAGLSQNTIKVTGHK
jgi:hypothetical protein